MSSKMLSLKWDNHSCSFTHVLSQLNGTNHFSDATIGCSTILYPVHRIVLSACSEYFSDIFDKTEGKHPVIVLKDISSDVFEALLNFMYLGQVDVKEESLPDILNAAECLEIKGLAVTDQSHYAEDSKRNNYICETGRKSVVQQRRKRAHVGQNTLCNNPILISNKLRRLNHSPNHSNLSKDGVFENRSGNEKLLRTANRFATHNLLDCVVSSGSQEHNFSGSNSDGVEAVYSRETSSHSGNDADIASNETSYSDSGNSSLLHITQTTGERHCSTSEFNSSHIKVSTNKASTNISEEYVPDNKNEDKTPLAISNLTIKNDPSECTMGAVSDVKYLSKSDKNVTTNSSEYYATDCSDTSMDAPKHLGKKALIVIKQEFDEVANAVDVTSRNVTNTKSVVQDPPSSVLAPNHLFHDYNMEGSCSDSLPLPLRSSTITVMRKSVSNCSLPATPSHSNAGLRLSRSPKKSSVHQPVVDKMPEFSPSLQPFLQGYLTDEQERLLMELKFREEVVKFLDTENLNVTTHAGGHSRWWYHAFGRQLYETYPYIQWSQGAASEIGGEQRKRPLAPWTYVMKKISTTRKSRRFQNRKRRREAGELQATAAAQLAAE